MDVDKPVTNEDETEHTEEEYAQQYFGFHPQHFLNGMYNVICEYMDEAFKAIKEVILNKFKDNITEEQLQKDSHEMKLLAVKRLDAKFDSAESYLLNNVFRLPDHLVLPEDIEQIETPCSETEMEYLDNNIQNVINRITAVKKANGLLEKRMAEIDHLQVEFSKTLEGMKKIRQEVHTGTSSVLQLVTDTRKVQEELRKLETL